MELKYIVLTIIKILISVPGILIGSNNLVQGAALIGGHLDNTSSNVTNSYYPDYEFYDSPEYPMSNDTDRTSPDESVTKLQYEESESENIPNPSPLVLPGYNLPENIFNKGKPFYLEKDPLTGSIDFNSKTPKPGLDDMYEYTDEGQENTDIYNKANIDRKDGSLNSHRPTDVNQLTPTFHDFLNLPVKYNSDKYVYPLISSSYANTKIQGNIQKYHNHKDYIAKPATYKPTDRPTYYSSTLSSLDHAFDRTSFKTSTTSIPQTKPNQSNKDFTASPPSVVDNYNEEYSEEYEIEPQQPSIKPDNDVYITTDNPNKIYLTTPPPGPVTTTGKVMSFFEQLFGDYGDSMTTEKPKLPELFDNLPYNKNKSKYKDKSKTDKTITTTSTAIPTVTYHNAHSGPNVMTGTNMGLEHSYEEYDDYANEDTKTDNVAVANKHVTYKTVESTTHKQFNYNPTDEKKTVIHANYVNTNITPQKDFDWVGSDSYGNDKYTTAKIVPSSSTTKHTTQITTTTEIVTPPKVTSLPLGENHPSGMNIHQPIIIATQNLREQLNNEKVVPKPFGFDKPNQNVPSTSNIHIAPDQDTVSFVVGHHQNVDGGQYVATALKESPYDSNPFRPFYGQQGTVADDEVTFNIGPPKEETYESKVVQQKIVGVTGSSVTIQPMQNSQASLAIGIPVNDVKQIPGHVMDEKLELENENIKFPKGSGPKIVFPNEKDVSLTDLYPPPPQPNLQIPPQMNREVLKLIANPMYHQLPSDLTPPKEEEIIVPPRLVSPRPPWDPRPGHFFSGKPEYARPPRPPPDMAYKRIDNLPNILPQFRPNMNGKPHGPHHGHGHPHPHFYDNRLNRQPLLERPSNGRPIGFFEKLQPPPPPKHLQNLRKLPLLPNQSLDPNQQIAEDRIMNENPQNSMREQINFFQVPPQVIANRRNGDDDEVETLQMIQAKHSEKKDLSVEPITISEQANKTDKPVYVVYPVNTPPIKLDVIDTNKRESVVIGTRAELPLPPSKINQNFNYEQNPILSIKDRQDSPILKPHYRPPNSPIKSDFPYPLERPDPSILRPVPETPNNGLILDEGNDQLIDDSNYISNNQWNTIGENLESRIVVGSKFNNHVSYTDKPIAVAYTPTQSNIEKLEYTDKYSMPNYGSPVIPEIRPGTVDSVKLGQNNEFTVSAIVHAHPQAEINRIVNDKPIIPESISRIDNHKTDLDSPHLHEEHDFQAPFQASVKIDSASEGWSVIREKSKMKSEEVVESTTLMMQTTSEFDIEHFKPQLEGGFKPIYSYPDDRSNESKETKYNERQE